MTFTPNVGSADRIARIVLGLALLSMLLVVDGPGKWWGLIGIVPLVTAFMRWCPAYSPFGFSTCKR